MPVVSILEVKNGLIVKKHHLSYYCKLDYALKACRIMKRKNSSRKLFIVEREWKYGEKYGFPQRSDS